MPAQKRKAPDAPETPESSGRRRSGRISTSGTKSQYFEGDSSEEPDAPPVFVANGGKKRGRGRPPKNATPGQTSSSKKTKKAKVEDDEDDGDDYAEEALGEHEGGDDEDDDEFDEDQEMRVTITPLIKLRETGEVPYEDERVHKNTMLFLKDLKANNKRPWLKCLSTPIQSLRCPH